MLMQIAPAEHVSLVHADSDTQFAFPNPASVYDWEIYFHIPYLIATALASQQRYAEALRWLHVWTTALVQGKNGGSAIWSGAVMCSASKDAVRMTAGHDEFHGSGPNHLIAQFVP